jgi:hypothetical protein
LDGDGISETQEEAINAEGLDVNILVTDKPPENEVTKLGKDKTEIV